MDAPAGQCRAAMYGGFPRRVVAPKGRSSGLRVGTGDAELLHAMAQRRRLDAQTYRGAALALDDPVRFAQRVQNVDSAASSSSEPGLSSLRGAGRGRLTDNPMASGSIRSTDVVDKINARSMMFSNSRMLPGHG